MSRLDNVQKIIVEDFKEEDQETVAKLATVLNFFMDNVVETVNGKLDFDNLNRELVTIEVTVNSNGTPITGGSFAGSRGAIGSKVISAVNLTNPAQFVEASPFVSFAATQTQGIYAIRNVRGIQPNTKYRLLMELIF